MAAAQRAGEERSEQPLKALRQRSVRWKRLGCDARAHPKSLLAGPPGPTARRTAANRRSLAGRHDPAGSMASSRSINGRLDVRATDPSEPTVEDRRSSHGRDPPNIALRSEALALGTGSMSRPWPTSAPGLDRLGLRPWPRTRTQASPSPTESRPFVHRSSPTRTHYYPQAYPQVGRTPGWSGEDRVSPAPPAPGRPVDPTGRYQAA